MPGFLDDYEPVETRLTAFWKKYPDGRMLTELVDHSSEEFVFRAEAYRDADDKRPAATGFAHEKVTAKGVNATSALENAETSAIGRALANLDFAAKGKRPSREEMRKTQRPEGELPDPKTVVDDWSTWDPGVDLNDWYQAIAECKTLAELNAVGTSIRLLQLSKLDAAKLRNAWTDKQTKLETGDTM
jgi:hypothetical protein